MTKKNVMFIGVILTVMALTIVTAVMVIQPESLAECDVYNVMKDAKSVFGGYVPDHCD